MLSNTIRQKFLAYFAKNGHHIARSCPVVAPQDPTLLFVNAGMNAFKNQFLGKTPSTYPRIATAQKCLRAGGKHNDLENVGHTSRHLTFFEMLGNFSFGDYFKKEAIRFAFDVSTEIFGFPEEKLWASVFTDDEEAFIYWKEYLPEERIVRFGEKENFWSMGDQGPCGPCSELYYDKGSVFSAASSPIFDPEGHRYIEFWNLVFMQQEQTANGLQPLPAKNIDTGAGLERILSLIDNKPTVFDTDVLHTIILRLEQLCNQSYLTKLAPHFRIIADHIRALCFAIADKGMPDNTKEGYVLRKILRRAARSGKALGLNGPFLAQLIPVVEQGMGKTYPELEKNRDIIEKVITQEEENYVKTLEKGGNLFQTILTNSSKNTLCADDAFKLKDTYGLPLEEILLLAKDNGLTVDLARFHALEKKARALSKKNSSSTKSGFSPTFFEHLRGATRFDYEAHKTHSAIVAIVQQEKFVNSIKEGEKGYIILQTTTLYPEKGGQIADKGTILSSNAIFIVEDTQEPIEGVLVHKGFVKKGSFTKKQEVDVLLDVPRRNAIAKHHTSVHILQWALQDTFGKTVTQQGSFVDQEKLRFDFSYNEPLTAKQLELLEAKINAKIAENIPISTYEILYEEIKKDPTVLQFFQDQYQKYVRVVTMQFSKELCAGTHAKSTGDLRFFCITKETAVAKGVRRIEAKAANAAFAFVQQERLLLQQLQTALKTPKEGLLEKMEKTQQEKQALQKHLRNIEKYLLEKIQQTVENRSEKPLVIAEVIPLPLKQLACFADQLCKNLPQSAVILGASEQTRCQIVLRLNSLDQFNAKEMMQKVAHLIEGGGGGKKTCANAGGKNSENLSVAIETLKNLIQGS